MRIAKLSKAVFIAGLSLCFAAAAPAQHGGSSGGGGGHSGGGSSGGGGGHVSSGGGHSGGSSGHSGGVSAHGGGVSAHGGGATVASGASNSHYAGSAYGTQAYMATARSAHGGWTGVSGWQEPPANPSHLQITWRSMSSANSSRPVARRGTPPTRVTMQRFPNGGMRHHHHHHGGDGDFDEDDGFFPGFGFGFGFFGGFSPSCFFSGISATCFFDGLFPPLFISPVGGPGELDGFAEPWSYGYAPGVYAAAEVPGSDEDVVGYAPVPPPEAPEAMAEEAAPLTLIFLTDGTNFAVTDYWLAGGKLHYITSYGGENSIAFERFDLQKTVDENYKLGILFSLRPAPAPDSAEPPAPAPPPVSPQPPAPPAS